MIPDNQIDRACELVWRHFTGQTPCDKWKQVSYGRAGGTVLQKDCECDNCYPSISIGSIHGRIGKSYLKLSESLDAWRPIWEGMSDEQKERRDKTLMEMYANDEILWLTEATPLHHLEAALAIEVECDRCCDWCGGNASEQKHDCYDAEPCTCTNGQIKLMDLLEVEG